METIAFYTFAALLVVITFGLIYYIASRAHRVCKPYFWPKVAALGFASIYLIFLLALNATQETGLGSVWFIRTFRVGPADTPFSLVFIVLTKMGGAAFIFVSTAAASFWGALVYAAAAIILRLRRKRV